MAIDRRHAKLVALGALFALATVLCARPVVPDEGAVALATSLLSERGTDLATHGLTRDNLAYYLVQGARLGKLEALLSEQPAASDTQVVDLIQTVRWKHKVERTLAAPGANTDILARLQLVGSTFADFSREVATKAAGADYRFILSGSLVKGHFSARSDIDVIIDTTSKDLAAWAMTSQWSTTVEHPADYDETLAIADAGDYTTFRSKLNLKLLGQTVAVAGEVVDADFLPRFYVQAMAARGVALEQTTFSPAYEPNNYLHSLEREMPIWMVNAIETAKNLREAVAAIFGGGGNDDDAASSATKASALAVDDADPVDPEIFVRLLRAARLRARPPRP